MTWSIGQRMTLTICGLMSSYIHWLSIVSNYYIVRSSIQAQQLKTSCKAPSPQCYIPGHKAIGPLVFWKRRYRSKNLSDIDKKSNTDLDRKQRNVFYLITHTKYFTSFLRNSLFVRPESPVMYTKFYCHWPFCPGKDF